MLIPLLRLVAYFLSPHGSQPNPNLTSQELLCNLKPQVWTAGLQYNLTSHHPSY